MVMFTRRQFIISVQETFSEVDRIRKR